MPSDQPHVRNCELLRLLHPESVYTDLVVPSSWTFNTNPGRLAISLSEVSAMYEKSFLLATEFVYRDRQIPFYSVSFSSDNNDELQYILMEFRSKTKGHRFSRWITRPNAVKVCNIDCIPCTCNNLQFLLTVILFRYHFQYCCTMGYVLVDMYNDLFKPFHSLMTQALANVYDVDSTSNDATVVRTSNLSKWKSCEFTGDECYAIVLEKLSPHITDIYEYVQFIADIPCMSLFFTINDHQLHHYVAVSFTMSLECFEQFNEDTYYHDYSEIIVSPDNTVNAKPLGHNETTFAQPQHDETVDYHSTEQGDHDYGVSLGDDDYGASACASVASDEDEIDVMIDEMYLKAQQVSIDGQLGICLPPPLTTLFSDIKIVTDPYLEAELTCTETGKVDLCWLSRSQAIQYCTLRGYVLVDEDFDLFQTFHHYTVEVIKLIHKYYYGDNNWDKKDSVYLRTWSECKFSGEESFEDVCQMMKRRMLCIGDYRNFITKIPHIDLIYSFKEFNYINHFTVSLIMTYHAFKKYLDECEGIDSNGERECIVTGEGILPTPSSTQFSTTTESNLEVETEWRKQFYDLYMPKFSVMKNSTLIGKEKYQEIVSLLLQLSSRHKKQPKSKFERDVEKKYVLVGNIDKRCLYCRTPNGTVAITTLEEVFDVMRTIHYSLGHPRDFRKNKVALDEKYFKIPEKCVRLFLQLCPMCFPSKRRTSKHRVPLKMIFSPEFGHRAQVDLIDMTTKAIYGYNYILRYVDHLSGFAHVACTRTKSAQEVGIKLVHILSTAITPEIFQSDNGNEFLGECIKLIKRFFPYIHIVKGRAYHPESQGKIERGHATFKESLQKWMEEYGDNWVIGASIVNHSINKRSQFNRGEKFSPYNFYYGKAPLDNRNVVFGKVAQQCCMTEYGMMAGHLFCNQCEKVCSNHLVTKEELEYVMRKGDELFNNVTNEDVEIAFVDDLRQHLKEIVEDALVRFSLYTGDQSKTADDMESKNSNEEDMEEEDEKEDEEGNRGRKYDGKHRNMKKRKRKINLTSNYFEDEVHELKRKCSSKLVYNDTINDSEVQSHTSVGSYVTKSLRNHKNYQKAHQSKNTLCEKRASLELIASSAQKKQADIINQ